jgi:glucose-1-phosphate thymidylyltransferase
MENCIIRDIARLENSVLGRRVNVRPAASNHDTICLMVGDDSVVEVKK